MADKLTKLSGYGSKSGSQSNLTCTLKLIILGDDNVGKSNLVEKFINNEDVAFVPNTIGANFSHKTVHLKGVTVKLNIWDMTGNERFKSLSLDHCRGEYAAIVVYDITNMDSLYTAMDWIKALDKVKTPPINVKLIGNKADLESRRMINLEKVQKYSHENKIDLMETSARTGLNVNKVFNTIIDEFLIHAFAT